MNRRFVLTLLAGASVTACAPLPSANPLSREVRQALKIAKIDVVTSGAAFESARAGDYSGRLAGDLTGVLRAEFADRMAPTGATLVVEVARLNIAGTTATQFGRDQSRLVGNVRLVSENGTLLATYSVTEVAGEPATTTSGALAAAAVTRADRFYRTLLDGFALSTREQVIGAYLPGERLVRRVAN